MFKQFTTLLCLSVLLGCANAHLAAFHKGMYCLNGVGGDINLNSYDIVSPLYQLPFRDWWFHHVNRCDEFPPAPGDFLDLPAGGSFKVEIASNRAKTTLSYNGRDTSAWPDGNNYPEDRNEPDCIISPNMHTQNRSMAAGTAFAISYHSDIKAVTPENLAVFTVRHNTPWKREVWYDVPAALPACPPAGCICAWGWVPNGCGQPNMYHQAFRCRVTGATSVTPIAAPKPPVWCQNNPGACTKGSKQMIYWNQAERNNIWVNGFDARGQHKSPGYNSVLGFADGAQNDIFSGAPASGNPPAGNVNPPATTAPSPQQTSGGSSAPNNNNANPNPANPSPVNPGGGAPSTGGNVGGNHGNVGENHGNTGGHSGQGNNSPGSSSPNTTSAPSSEATPGNEGYTNYNPQCKRSRRRRRSMVEKRASKARRHNAANEGRGHSSPSW